MIKTHKPRGYFWTCASGFQQSREFRDINFEDCTPPVTEIICPDSDDDLRPSQRSAKRRKIEKLADDFLNGEPLVISCTRPHTASLKATVEWNERSRRGEKWSLPAFEKPEDDSQLWDDVENPWEMLQKPSQKRKSKGKQRASRTQPVVEDALPQAETVTEVQQATSGCKPVRRRAKPTLSTEPSTEAWKQAAALRARGLQRAATEAPRVSDTIPQLSMPEADTVKPRSEPVSLARPRYFRNRKPPNAEWLLRQKTSLYDLSPNESFDELNRTPNGTPTRTQGQHANQLIYSPPIVDEQVGESGPVAVVEDDAEYRAAAEDSRKVHEDLANTLKSSADPLSLSFSQKLAAATQADKDASSESESSHTVEDDIDTELTPGHVISQHQSQADRQTELLKRQGRRAAPRTSWASSNEQTPVTIIESAPDGAAENVTVSFTAASSIRQSTQDAAQSAGKFKRGKRAKSAGIPASRAAVQSTRRRTAPPESQSAQEQMASLPVEQQRRMSAFRVSQEKPEYTEVQPEKEGGTPFMFRKKRGSSKTNDDQSSTEATAKLEKKGHRPMTFLSSEEARAGTGKQRTEATEAIAAHPPAIDMPLAHDSSFGMRLNMALVDEHLNAVLPNAPGSSRRSSAVKRALRDQLIASGASISRVEGEPTSSQVEPQGTAGPNDNVGPSREDVAGEGVGLGQELAERGLADSLRSSEISGRQSLRSAIEVARRESASNAAETQWPGTQAMLYQAQHDLFDSPEKPSDFGHPNAKETPELSKVPAVMPTDSAAQQPLRELSQEQLPGTQAMVEAWSPWSTVKKPKVITARTAAPSPAMRGSGTARRRQSALLSGSAPDTIDALDESSRRRSSLRFSTTASDSPAPSSRLNFAVTKSSSQENNDKHTSSGSVPTPKSILKPTATTTQPFEIGAPLISDPTTVVGSFEATPNDPTNETSGSPHTSCYEADQGHLMPQISDVSDLDRTINELTADVLGTNNEMAGVLSRPRC